MKVNESVAEFKAEDMVDMLICSWFQSLSERITIAQFVDNNMRITWIISSRIVTKIRFDDLSITAISTS